MVGETESICFAVEGLRRPPSVCGIANHSSGIISGIDEEGEEGDLQVATMPVHCRPGTLVVDLTPQSLDVVE